MSERAGPTGGPPARAALPPRRRRREILEAAARVFHEKGYAATSIQDIADEVGILKGSLYYYITSKEDLLFEILRDVHADSLKALEAIDDTTGDSLQKVRAFVTLHVTHVTENIRRTAVFFNDFRSLGDERRRVIREERETYEGYFRRLLAAAQKEGTVCPDLDVKLTAIEVLGMMNWIHHWYRPGGPQSARQIAQTMADLVVAGIACDPSTHTRGHRQRLAALPAGPDPAKRRPR